MSGVVLLLPKLAFLAAVLAAFVIDSLPLGDWRRRLLLGIGALFLAAAVFDLFLLGEETRFWDGSLIVDRYAIFSDLALLALGIVITLSVINTIGISKESGDFFLLLYLSLLGASALASAGTLVSLFLAVELAIIPSWALVAFRLAHRRGFEAALKYFILSVFASAILLYGLSLIYGMSGSVRIPLEAEVETSGLLVLGIALVVVGFGFELAAFPFHQWLPDVFDAAAAEVSAFLAVAPKLAGIVALVRVVGGFPGQSEAWEAAVAVLAVASMFWGNLLAFWQVTVRRLLAYSAVAHAGYALVGVAANTDGGRDGAVLYFAAYGSAVVGAFLVVALLAREGVGDLLTDFNGLGRRRPFLAFIMTLFLISLVGVPLFAGFWGKFTVFWGAVQGEYVWLAVLGVVNSAVSLGYYARIIQRMYLAEPDTLMPGDSALLARASAGGVLSGPPVSGPSLAAATSGAGVTATPRAGGAFVAVLEQPGSSMAAGGVAGHPGGGGTGPVRYPPEAEGEFLPEGARDSSAQDWGLWAALAISFILTMLLGIVPRLLFGALGS
jgi:NADH-quinone oxidoreductase subunit N